MAGPNNRRNRIRNGVTGTGGGVDPSSIPLSFEARQQARQRFNQRVRETNKRKRERANRINTERRAAAQADWQERTKAPDYTSNENYQRALADNQAQFQQAQAGLDDQERGFGIAYGLGQYGADIANNPYSRAAMLQRSYNQNQRASINTMAARGQLYSGATQNAANANTFNYGSAYDALSKDFGARTNQIGLQRQQAQDRLGAANERAARRAVDEASKLFPTTRENAPRFVRPKVFKPKFMRRRPPIRRPNPNRPRPPAAPGAVRP